MLLLRSIPHLHFRVFVLLISEYLFQLVNQLLNFRIALFVLYSPEWLICAQIGDYIPNQPFDGRKLPPGCCWESKLVFWDEDFACGGSDNLSVEVRACQDSCCV